MHHINSYEVDPHTIIADAVVYPNLDVMYELQLSTMRDPKLWNTFNANSRLKRYTIHLDTGRIESEALRSKHSHLDFISRLDLPCINEKFRFRSYCYVYGVVLKADGIHTGDVRLVKKNMCTHEEDSYWSRENHYVMEPTFIPNPNSIKEDDGYLFSHVLDGQRKLSYLGIWNASTMELINFSYLPSTIPFSLHGHFFEGTDFL